MISCRRYVVRPGNLATLALERVDIPAPAAGEVQVKIKAIGLNFADVFAIWGLYGAAPKTPFTPGLEYAGEVAEVGSGVTGVKPGDRVMGVTRFGAYCDTLNIDVRYVTPLPTGWDFATGAAYLVQTLTAYYGLVRLGNLENTHTVLIHSAVGGVGLQALQIAKALGAYTIGTVGNIEKCPFALEAGYDAVIVRDKDFKEKLKIALANRELNLVMDSIGGRYFTIPFELLAPMGRVVVFGAARYASPGNRPNYLHLLYHFLRRPKIDPQKLPEKNKAVLGFNLIWLYERAHLLHTLLHELEGLALRPPHVGHRFGFEDLPQAIKLFQTGLTKGKVVVELP